MFSLLRNKLFVGVALFALLAAASAGAMTNAYLKKRDDLVQQELKTDLEKARAEQYYADLLEQQRLSDDLNQTRVDLLNRVAELESREVETITEIREVWRDREVIVEHPVAADCAAERVPGPVIRLLCDSGEIHTGVCAHMPEDSS